MNPPWSVWPRGLDDVRGPELPATAAEARLRYNAESSYEVRLPFTPAAWVATARGTRVEIRRHGALLDKPQLTAREFVVDEQSPAGAIALYGESDEGLLADRDCFPDPTKPFLSQTNGATYQQTGPGETVAKTLVNLNAGPGSLAARRIAGLTVEPDQGRGITYPTVLRYANLLETLQVIGRDWGPLGFRIVPTDTGQAFQTFTPPDLSASLRFSLALGNLDGLRYREDAPTVTVVMVEGVIPESKAADGTVIPPVPLKWVQTSTDPDTLAYGRVAEQWIDLGERVTSLEDLKAAAREALGDHGATVGLNLTPSADLTATDPRALVGALVTVQVGPLGYTDTIEVPDRIREIHLAYDQEKGTDTVTPVVGSDGASSDALFSALNVDGINRRLGRLERR